jgi:hypothetical protein
VQARFRSRCSVNAMQLGVKRSLAAKPNWLEGMFLDSMLYCYPLLKQLGELFFSIDLHVKLMLLSVKPVTWEIHVLGVVDPL